MNRIVAVITIAMLVWVFQSALSAAQATRQPKSLAAILDAQPDEVKARYPARHPQETLEFFGIEPGMTVVEVLPGRVGWYSKLLIPRLGADGKLIGANYSLEAWRILGFLNEAQLKKMSAWLSDWPVQARTWRQPEDAEVSAFVLGALPESMHGTADAVLFIRALHNLSHIEGQGGFLSAAIKNAYDALKPGGYAGVVQHHARDHMPDDWADGSNGYLKKGFVITKMVQGGFEYVSESDINVNDEDQPTTKDFVWRLPPSLNGAADNPELRAEMTAIGESNRMTLKFRKPGS